MTAPPGDAVRHRGRALLVLAAIVLVVGGANIVAADLADALDVHIRPRNEDLVHRLIMTAAAAYTLLLALPFVPGVELGLAIIGVLGPKILPLVYLCTVAGLSMSYLAGRLIALETLAVWFADLRFDRTAALLRRLAPMSRDERLACLVDATPRRLVPTLLRHRYLAIALALNLPGNFLLGGGGGIALIAGVSGLYSPLAFVVTAAIAISPVPLAIVFLGAEVLAG